MVILLLLNVVRFQGERKRHYTAAQLYFSWEFFDGKFCTVVSIWQGMSILTCQVLKFCSVIRVVMSVFNIVC